MTLTDERQGWTSASNAESDLLCPGRHIAQRGLPEVKSEDAESGTRIHLWLSAYKKDAPYHPEVSEDELEIAEACAHRRKEVLSDWSLPDTAFIVHVEERLWCAVKEYKHTGQPDMVCIQGNRALVLDYKTGRNEVPEPNTNQQLRDLACLVSIRWVVDEVTVAIVQPFAKRQPPCVYDEKDIAQAMKEMRARVIQSNNPMSPRIAGEKQCKYCRAKGACREYSEWTKGAMPLMAASGMDLHKPWTPEQWSNFLSIAPEAEAWIESKRNEARELLKANPDAIPGYELRNGVREKITNVQAVFEETTKRGVSQDDFMKSVSVTKKGLKEALRTTGLKGKELDEAMYGVLFGNTESTPISPLLVRKT